MPRIAAYPDFPSATEVLSAVGLAGNFTNVDEVYRRRGKALHLAIEYHHGGVLDVESLHPQIRPGIDGYRVFLEREQHVAEYSELELVHKLYGVVGHVDRVGSIRGEGRAIFDWKYTKSPDLKAGRYQVAGYRLLYNFNFPDAPAERGYVVQLHPETGECRVHDVTDDYAVEVFKAALMVWRAREGR